MKTQVAALTTILVTLTCGPEARADEPRYTITDLGTLGGATSWVSRLTPLGAVAGRSQMASSAQRATVWTGGELVASALDNPPGFTVARANAINDLGLTAVTGEGNPQSEAAFLFDGSTYTPLGMLAGHDNARAADINDAGVVAVNSYLLGVEMLAARWDSGVLTPLGDLGGDYSRATAINDAGVIVGRAGTDLAGTPARGFVHDGDSMAPLPPLSTYDQSSANGLNEDNVVVGSSFNQSPPYFLESHRACLWDDEGVTDLGTLDGFGISTAMAVNAQRQVVGNWGFSASSTSQNGWLWEDGMMTNLEDLIDPASGWDILNAVDINDDGLIIGNGVNPDGHLRGFLLTPIEVCSADVTGDDTVGVEDLLVVLGAWGPCPGQPCAGDTDESGTVDITDLLTVLGAWGACGS